MVCQFLINNLKRGHLSNETWMLRTTEPETVKTIHIKQKNVWTLPNWEAHYQPESLRKTLPRVTTWGKQCSLSPQDPNRENAGAKTHKWRWPSGRFAVVSGELICPHLKQMEHPGLLSHTPGTILYCVFCQEGGEAWPGLQTPCSAYAVWIFPGLLGRLSYSTVN